MALWTVTPGPPRPAPERCTSCQAANASSGGVCPSDPLHRDVLLRRAHRLSHYGPRPVHGRLGGLRDREAGRTVITAEGGSLSLLDRSGQRDLAAELNVIVDEFSGFRRSNT